MAKFSRYEEYDGESINGLTLRHILNKVFDICNKDNIGVYWSVFINDYWGKNIEIKITDIKKEKECRERGLVK